MTVHNFAESLELSHKYVDAPWWQEVYAQAFPLATMASVRQDGWAQRGGIDRVITLSSGKTLRVDEKVRERTWPDFALEYWSDEERRVPGWIAKDLACDYIAYAFVPIATCYLLPFEELRRAWRQHHRVWVKSFPRIVAQNVSSTRSYRTVCVGVPIDTVLDAITDATIIKWQVSSHTRSAVSGELL